MFLYAQIYWLAEFGDVSCLQFNYLRVETLTTCIIKQKFYFMFSEDKFLGDGGYGAVYKATYKNQVN
jgi:hypothetical protein